jgi:hypothetical protein
MTTEEIAVLDNLANAITALAEAISETLIADDGNNLAQVLQDINVRKTRQLRRKE